LGSLFIPNINPNASWIQYGITVAGGHGKGKRFNQLFYPSHVYVDDDQNIYVSDYVNDRIVKWKKDATRGQILVDGNGKKRPNDLLSSHVSFIVDKDSDALIIADRYNQRVIQQSLQNERMGETIISDIDCMDLKIDNDGYLYILDYSRHEVIRCKTGDANGTRVVGGYCQGTRLDQLSGPYNIFVDQDHSIYISDSISHCVMKWMKDAKEGIVVAGGNGQGNSLTQLSNPCGIIVDQLGTIYVVDSDNHRVIRWPKEATEGNVVVGGNGAGEQPNQLNYPCDLSFDRQGNLYVTDRANHRIQKFNIEQNCS
jgi:sugar lactone lactonase YvrE